MDTDSDSGITLPRDNPIKDFLHSSNQKFAGFKSGLENFYSVLVIVWDDFIYEPISSLLSSSSGLFTHQSFARDENGCLIKFTHVDGVVIIRHLHQLIRASRELALLDSKRHVLDYGRNREFPPKAFIQNPEGQKVPAKVLEALQAYPPSPMMGAEYMPIDAITWV